MANSKVKNKAKENKKKAEKCTSATMTVKVNGRKIEHSGRKFLKAVGIILLPLAVGIIASVCTISAQESFNAFAQPPLAPPAWLFPVVWTILYLMMGVASYLIYRVKVNNWRERRLRVAELAIFYVQLIFNFAWTLIFFNSDMKYFAFGWLIAMWLMILAFILMAFRNRKAAAWLMVPYILWCTFAAYLNIAIAILN